MKLVNSGMEIRMKTNWTQLWLAYKRREDMGNGELVRSVAVKGFDRTNRVIASGLNELRQGIKGMLGIDLEMEARSRTGILICQKT